MIAASCRHVFSLALLAWLLVVPALALQPPRDGQSEFVPIAELPPGDQLPAAPLLIGAYAFVWIVLFVYLWSIWRRLRQVDTDLSALAKRFESRR